MIRDPIYFLKQLLVALKTRFSRLETLSESKRFCKKPILLQTTKYPDLFITYKERFNMHTGQRNPLHLSGEEHYGRLSTQFSQS